MGTATGPANLEADWTANTINLEWYNEDTKLTVPTTSNTCRYDGGITLPSTNPTKTGYTFRGWQVRIQQTLDCSIYTPQRIQTWAEWNEYVRECESHSGCVWNGNQGGEPGEGCFNIVPLESTSYTTCAEITDRDTCMGLYKADVTYQVSGHDEFRSLCAFIDNYCIPYWRWGLGSTNIEMPESFCEELGGDSYENGNCYVDD